VIFPMLSAASGEPAEYRKIFNGFIKLSSVFLLALVVVFFAEPILAFFPTAYQDYVTVFRLIIFLALSIIIFNPVDIVAYSLDITRRYFNWIMFYSVIQVVIMVVSLAAGLEPFLYTMTLFNLVIYVLSFFALVKGRAELSLWDWVKPVVAFGIVIAIVSIIIS